MGFHTMVPTTTSSLAFFSPRRHAVLTRVFAGWIVLSLALVTVPCCEVFGSAHAAPATSASHHADESHETGHSHSAPVLPDGGPDDHCPQWVDVNPFLTSDLALLAPSIDTPVWHATAVDDLMSLKAPEPVLRRPPNIPEAALPRLYLLYGHLLL